MITKKVYICEDSVEGIFTSIYDAWSSRYGHDNIRIRVQTIDGEGINMELFSEYIYVKADEEKTRKVASAIQGKISEEAYNMVCHAVCSADEAKGDIIYRFLILGFSIGPKVIDYLSNDAVINIFNLNRNVGNEVHRMIEFLRFKQGDDNILMAKIDPKNDVLRMIAPHFSDRFGLENFIIYDEKRKTAILHRSGFQWIFTTADYFDVDRFKELSVQEKEFQLLWKTFFKTIAIKERINEKLQRNNLPKHFRSNMLEFDAQE